MTELTKSGQQLLAMMSTWLAHGEDTSLELLNEQFEYFRRGFIGISDEEASFIHQSLIEQYGVSVAVGATISGGYLPWYEERKESVDWFYWKRYKEWIGTRLAPEAVRSIDRSTDEMIRRFADPFGDGIEDRRGMGLGDVQAGKTSHYTGLVCKAADLGYRVIIIVAGIHENLRSQTQDRIDAGFCGWYSAGPVDGVSTYGVGKYDASHRPTTFTTTDADFRQRAAEQIGLPLKNLKQPVVFVVKKNPKILENLIKWLKSDNLKNGEEFINEALLLIDDEADNASINISKKPETVSKINGSLRALLRLFRRRTYCAYTATPFANIFIEPTTQSELLGPDLFPRDFLTTLDRPSNYFGSEKVFGDDEDGPIRFIKDRDPFLPEKMPKDFMVEGLPESLKDAVRAFLIIKAIRINRGHTNQHNSMLVNVSPSTAIQNRVRNLIEDFVEHLRSSINVHALLPLSVAKHDKEISAFETVYMNEFAANGCSWPAVLSTLPEAIDGCLVKAENSASKERINYKSERSGLTVIGVGGYSLGRGLTLEGLSVSYLLRNTKTYDTLMQMARWFGYRPGYEDLCRIWMTEGSKGWYAFIGEATEELRTELIRMQYSNQTPETFGLKVQSHPATLEVTARNKQGTSKPVVVKIDLVGRIIETTVVHAAPSLEAKKNKENLISLASSSINFSQANLIGSTTGRLFSKVPVTIVRNFLANWHNHRESNLTNIDPILAHIDARQGEEWIKEWDVAFVGTGLGKGPVWNGFGFDISSQIRGMEFFGGGVAKASQRRFSSRGVAKIGMSDDAVRRAEKIFRGQNTQKSNVPDSAYATHRDRALLAIHTIHPRDQGPIDEPVFAWTIVFPYSNLQGETVEYRANTTWLLEYDDLDDDEYDPDG